MANSPIATHHVLQFTTNVELLLQQEKPHFSGSVEEGSYVGKAGQVVAQYGEAEMLPLLQADWKGDTLWSEIDHQQRWVLPSDFAVSLPVASQDQLRLITEPKDPYARAIRAAYARKYDDLIITAAIGQAKTGPYDAMVDTTLPVAQQIPVNSSGLTLAKLLLAREILEAAENDPNEPRYMATTSRQISELLNTTEIKSADYNTVKALAQGQINTFMGFTFLRSQRLKKATTTRSCFAWQKSGIHLGAWNRLEVRVDERPDKNYVWQIYARATLGATRTQEKKVVQIDCLES
jgi:hypothetical protein